MDIQRVDGVRRQLPARTNQRLNHGLLKGLLVVMWAALISVGLCASAAASTVLRLDLESLVANSDQIVEAEVLKVEARVEDGKVFTYTVLKVEDGVKGAQDGDVITIKQIGGRTEELATRVAGVPQFKIGERVVVFLEQEKADTMPVVTGMSQGKFHVALGPDNLTPYVVPFLGDLNLLAPAHPALKPQSNLKTQKNVLKRLDTSNDAQNSARNASPKPSTMHPMPIDQSVQRKHPAARVDVGNLRQAQPAELYTRVTPLKDFKRQIREVVEDQAPDDK